MMQRLHSFTSLNAMAAYLVLSQGLVTLAHARKPLLVKMHVAEDTDCLFSCIFFNLHRYFCFENCVLQS